ncbi:MAG: pyrophosphokinae, partial [Pseudomonadota bacterium]
MRLEVEDILVRARTFAEPFLSGELLDTGENMLAHADAVVAILDTMNSGND